MGITDFEPRRPPSSVKVASPQALTGPSERMIVLLLSAIAFLVALSAFIVFPLGPFLAADLDFPPQQVGFIGGAFSITAGIGSLASAIFLDRFDRRSALVVCAIGFVVATALSVLAGTMAQFLATRAFSGLFAGPLSGLVVAITADNVPEERRGAAVGILIGTYGFALVVGLPLGVAIAASSLGWKANFVGIAFVSLALTTVVARAIGAQRSHLAGLPAWRWGERFAGMGRLITSSSSVIAFLLIASASYAALLISPNLAVFALYSAGLTTDGLAKVYLLSGVLTILVLPLTGRLADAFGAVPVSTGVALATTAVLLAAFVDRRALPLPLEPVLALVIASQLMRSTVNQAWVTRVPAMAERAAFQAMIAAVSNFAQAAGAASAPLFLGMAPDGRLIGMGNVALLAIAATWIAPPLLVLLDRILIQQTSARP